MQSRAALSYRQGIAVAIAALVLLGAGMILFELNWQASAGKYLDEGKLSDAQTESINVMLDLFQLLMTWALGILGATAFFLKLNIEKGLRLRQVDLFLSLAIVVASVLSLFFGHLGIDRTAELLSLYQYPVNNEGLRLLARLQYLAFFSAVLLFGVHIFQFFWARVLTSNSDQPTEVRNEDE